VRVLFLTHRLPYAANRGDRIRALHLLRFLATHADVDLVSLVHDADEQAHAGDLADLAASVAVVRTRPVLGYAAALAAAPTDRPFTHALLDAPGLDAAVQRAIERHPPDVVLAYCSGMARVAMERPLSDFPMVLDMLDVDSEKWKALGVVGRAPARWIYASEARRLASFERLAVRTARSVMVVNERERASLRAIEPTANVHTVPNGIAIEEFRSPQAPSPEPRVAFCGVMAYPPNADAAVWFARDIWPAIRRAVPTARLSLIGSDPPRAVRNLAVDPTIEVTGTVPDVRPHLWRAAVAVAPLRVARGIQNKVLEALAAGLPCVVTSAVSEGLPPEAAAGCRVADEAAAFATRVIELLTLSPAERRAVSQAADLQSLGWPARLAPVLPLLISACSQSAKRAMPSANGVDGR
jgi:sugar transferase (PEP-CTERM/EpsH1 system associated)